MSLVDDARPRITTESCATTLADHSIPDDGVVVVGIDDEVTNVPATAPLLHDHANASLLGADPRCDGAKRAHGSLPVLLARELTRHLDVVGRRVNYMQPDLDASRRFFIRPAVGGGHGSRTGRSSTTTSSSNNSSSGGGVSCLRSRGSSRSTSRADESSAARTRPYVPKPRKTVPRTAC